MSSFEQIMASDPILDISRGLYPAIAHVNKFGENKNSLAGTMLPVWDIGTAYTYPATAVITHVSQAVDQPTLRGGSIDVQGLDANWLLVSQNVSLDATLTTTAVALTTPLLRVFRMKVHANVVTTQLVSAHNAANTVTYAQIGVGSNQTLMALYTVPANKTAYITQYYGDVLEDPVATKDPDATEFSVWAADRANGYEFQIKHAKGVPKQAGGFSHKFAPSLKITEKTDIKMTTQCSGKAGHVHAGFDLVLVNN